MNSCAEQHVDWTNNIAEKIKATENQREAVTGTGRERGSPAVTESTGVNANIAVRGSTGNI